MVSGSYHLTILLHRVDPRREDVVAKPIPVEVREIIAGLRKDQPNLTYEEIAKTAKCGVATVGRVLGKSTRGESLEPKAMGGAHNVKVTEEGRAWFGQRVGIEPDVTLERLADEFHEKFGVRVVLTTVSNALQALGLTLKKKSFRASQKDTDRVKELEDNFLDEVRDVDPARLVFVDEAGSNAAMTPSHGRAPSGERVVESRGFKKAANISMVGMVRLGSPMEVVSQKSSFNGLSFASWVKSCLVLRLRPGDVVIMDNVRFHKNKAVREAIREAGAFLVFQPPYSPEFNPIEEAWSKLKHLLRRAKARTTDTLHQAIQTAAAAITPTDLLGWFSHAGYRIRSA